MSNLLPCRRSGRLARRLGPLVALTFGLTTLLPATAGAGSPPGSLRTISGAVPVVGDWDGDGRDGIGVWDNGVFYLSNSSTPGAPVDIVAPFGNPGDLPIVGDWDGDGRDGLGIWREAVFHIRNEADSRAGVDAAFLFGTPDDTPVIGDWDGDGTDTVGIWRDGQFHLSNRNGPGAPTDAIVVYGSAATPPVVGDWNGDGRDTMGIRAGITFFLSDTPVDANLVDPPLSLIVPFGDEPMVPLAGDWNGDGRDGLAVRSGLTWYLLENPAAGNRADRAIAFGNPNVVEAVRAPRLTVTPLVDGLSNPWDLAFTSDGAILMTERGGALSVRLADGTFRRLQADFSDLLVSGESGLLGIDVDTEFSTNRRFYTCQATLGPSVKVVAWQVDAAYTRAVRVADPLVGGLPSSGGRHGGCRPRVGFDGALWIGTGDAAIGSTPQDVGSLGGKVLRVDRFSGAAPADNPDHGGDRRVYSYGHRNVQGLAFRPGYYQVWTTEHGPDVDDEVNRIIPGNYGWNPVPGYNENVPMTDLARYPGAVPAAWSSGRPTLAVSGADFLVGRAWGSWRGGLAVAALKDQTLRIVMLNPAGAVIDVVAPPELFGTFGRLRSARLGPDGNLYVTTDNGTGRDALLRVTPS